MGKLSKPIRRVVWIDICYQLIIALYLVALPYFVAGVRTAVVCIGHLSIAGAIFAGEHAQLPSHRVLTVLHRESNRVEFAKSVEHGGLATRRIIVYLASVWDLAVVSAVVLWKH
jgi:hypothetical protein